MDVASVPGEQTRIAGQIITGIGSSRSRSDHPERWGCEWPHFAGDSLVSWRGGRSDRLRLSGDGALLTFVVMALLAAVNRIERWFERRTEGRLGESASFSAQTDR